MVIERGPNRGRSCVEISAVGGIVGGITARCQGGLWYNSARHAEFVYLLPETDRTQFYVLNRTGKEGHARYPPPYRGSWQHRLYRAADIGCRTRVSRPVSGSGFGGARQRYVAG